MTEHAFVTLNLTPKEKRALQAHVDRLGVKRAPFIREAIAAHMQATKPKKRTRS